MNLSIAISKWIAWRCSTFVPLLANVHSEGRALLLRASLSTVLLARISIPISRCNLYAVQACGFDCSRH